MMSPAPHTCRLCGQHRAVFCIRGRWKADHDHDLCPRCWRATMNRARALRLPSRWDRPVARR